MNVVLKWLYALTGKEEKAKSIAMSFHKRLGDGSIEAKQILAELSAYCWAMKPHNPDNKDLMLFNEGKRDVLFHILDMIGLKDADFYDFNNEATKQLRGETNDIKYY